MKGKSLRRNRNSVDQMMWTVSSSLVRDFQTNLNDPTFCSDYAISFAQHNLSEVRRLMAEEAIVESDTYRFKSAYQIASLLKRYRFQTDTYSDSELSEMAIKSFRDTQNRIRNHNYDSLCAFTQKVLEYARMYIAQTLGVYSDEEHRNLCRFGRRASIGIPARAACEAARWELPISGSSDQISWFDSEMSQYSSVQDYWMKQLESDPNRSIYQEVTSLTLTLVPKSYKSLRSIMPNSTIGSYMSFGLGEIIRKRLRRKGYDIGKLQMKHRALAKAASEHNCYVTADLSSASDSISVRLVEMLFPPDWVRILTQSRIGNVSLPDGSVVQSETFCTMGIGYTFPLQTLVFLSIIKAVEAVKFRRWNRRLVSVYGDDMIYHVSLHKELQRALNDLGFIVNVDKTFSDGPFRESCGGDYHRGVDVRPFQPKNGPANVGDKTYEAMLYKFINGLLMRWSEHEIAGTLKYLTSEIERVTGKCKLVPSDYPDDSGIKVCLSDRWEFLQRAACANLKHVGHGVYRFSFLRLVSLKRGEKRHEPYLWLALQGCDLSTDVYAGDSCNLGACAPCLRHEVLVNIEESTGVVHEYVPQLHWEIAKPIKAIRSELTGRRLRRMVSSVTVSHTGRYTRQSGTSCFECRR